jgi:hypothetical protein
VKGTTFYYYFSFILLFGAFDGDICRKYRYMVTWEKPLPQKVVCQQRQGQVDLGNRKGRTKNRGRGFAVSGTVTAMAFLVVICFFRNSFSQNRLCFGRISPDFLEKHFVNRAKGLWICRA